MKEPVFLKKTKRLIKQALRAARRRYVGTFHGFDTTDLASALRKLGVARGQILLVHSSFDAFEGFHGTPSDIIEVLEDLVGPDGTILMPSLPFMGTAVDYVRSGMVTDIARTPSRTGLLTEVFRRQKGTLRSVHPTHPVLARGAQAEAMLVDHRHATTPCGVGSPFAKLLEQKGKILLLGVSIDAMTFFHFLEERFEDRLRPSPIAPEVFEALVKAAAETVTVTTRLYDTGLSRRRSILPLLPKLLRVGGCASGKVGVLEMLLVDAEAACLAFEKTLDCGISFYE